MPTMHYVLVRALGYAPPFFGPREVITNLIDHFFFTVKTSYCLFFIK